MITLEVLTRRVRPAFAGVAVAATITLALAGCATGAGPGAGDESTTATNSTGAQTAEAEPTAAPDDDRLDANVIVLDARYDSAAGTIEVSSIVNNHIGEGTCTVDATSAAGESLQIETEALPDAQSTVCPTATLEDVPAGEWTVTVTFDSDEAFGTSESTPVEAL